MLARCPACRTVFRVRSEQLRAHHGQVRCGSCLIPFDALENLLEESPPAPAQPAPAAVPELPPDRADRFFVLEEKTGDTYSEQLDFELPDTLLPQRQPIREAADLPQEPEERESPPPLFPTFVADDDSTVAPAADADLPGKARTDTPDGADESLAPDTLLPPDTDTRSRQEPSARTPDEPARHEPTSAWAESEPFVAPLEPAFAAGESTAAEREDAQTEGDDALDAYAPTSRPPLSRNLLGLGIGLLSGVLVAQSIYLFRAEIAREWPLLRPALVRACKPLNCTVELSRVAGVISVEASDLQSEPGKAGRFILHATIRNRAHHPQAFPHLELTLTDARDRPLARRVLPPQDWTPGADLEHGFAAGRDVIVTLPFAANGLDATGYRIYAFYP